MNSERRHIKSAYERIDIALDRIAKDQKLIKETRGLSKVNCIFKKVRPYSVIVKAKVVCNKVNKVLYIKTPIKIASDSAYNMEKGYNILKEFGKKFKKFPKYNVVTPSLYYRDIITLVTEESKGLTINTVIKDGARLLPKKTNLKRICSQVKSCGEWLKVFQGVSSSNKYFQVEDEINFIHNQLNKCSEKKLCKHNTILYLHRYIDGLKNVLIGQPIKMAGMHPDFIASNILANGENITVLDFDGYRQGSTYRNVANFLHSLDSFLNNPMFRPTTINILKKEFLSGYGVDISIQNQALFRVFQIREILGGLIQLSMRVNNSSFGKLKYKRLKMRSERTLLSMQK